MSTNELEHLSTAALIKLFKTLEAPTIEDMNGEYAAHLLAKMDGMNGLANMMIQNPVMPWQCKAFRPVNNDTGRGYNTFMLGGKTIQLYAMQTCIAPSRFDGRPSYHLIYRYFHSLCGSIHMVDEVRFLKSGVYLGMGTWGFTDAQRQVAFPFLLEGPVAAYRTDIGRARKGFNIGSRELPALA